MPFKKFIQYISEKKKNDAHKIEEVKPDLPPIDPSVAMTCPKCGESEKVCDCYIDDYYNAKTPQYTPKGKTKKKKNE
jgi:hypothetical protein